MEKETNSLKRDATPMIKAIITKGVIVPRDPLPEDWREGTEVAIEKLSDNGNSGPHPHPTDVWMDEVESLARQGDPQDDKNLAAALDDVRRREKERARQRLDLQP